MAEFGEHSTGRQKILIVGGPDTMIEHTNDPSTMTKRVLVSGDMLKVHDGYHTLDELYDHRITLFIALCRVRVMDVWRSRAHSDGKGYMGWFILGIGKEAGKQITYHIPEARWTECDFAETLEKAPEFDGHTPAEVLERLKAL